MANTEEFRKLLAEAIHRISTCEANKPINVIHDELGYALGKSGAGTAIAHWRKGNLPQIRDLERLAKEVIKRSDLGKEWLSRFLASADHPYAENFCNELFPTAELATSLAGVALAPHQLLFTKSYRELTGREALVNATLSVLSDPDARAIVAIDGVGGIGKTALAQEIALVCRKKKLFQNIVWISAARSTPGSVDGANALTFDSMLNAIGNQLGVPDITQLSAIEKAARVHALFHRYRILLILDNLETAGETQSEIIRRLQSLIGTSKALLTSRQRFFGDLYTIHLDGLSSLDAHQFLRYEANERNISVVANSVEAELERIVQTTGGSPLAMKLVVGQLSYLALDVILNHLQAVKPLTHLVEEDEYLNLYKHIYIPSWLLLSDSAKDLLVTMAPFVPGYGGTLSAIQAVGNMKGDELPIYIRELWQLSFLESGEATQSNLSDKRYHIHALTKHFVLSDIVNRKS